MLIQTETFSGVLPGPHLLITGGIHGDEFEPMAAIRRLAETLRQQRPLRGRVTLAPVVNKPAFLRGNRVAEDGQDLARTCPGRADGSITERIAHELSQHIRTADAYIDLHTGGTRLMVEPLVGYVLHPDDTVLTRQRGMAEAFGLGIIWGTDPNLPGRSLSVARDANIPAIYAEYLGGGMLSRDGIVEYAAGCLRVMQSLGMVEHAPECQRATPILRIEDATPQSGHMQIAHPAPCAGFFETRVELGDVVQRGDILGVISDVLGHESIPILAQRSGRVIVLHTFAQVEAGTGLAVILPVEAHQES